MCNKWCVSPTLTLKKSKFRAFCIPIKSNLEIPELLKEVYKIDKTVEKASHPTMYAWRTATSTCMASNPSLKNKGKNKNNNLEAESIILNKLVNQNQGFNDNNEGGSGLRILGMIERIRLVNILIVVSRWYGGTPLGPARFKCMSDVGMEALQIGNYLNTKPRKGWIDCLKINQVN